MRRGRGGLLIPVSLLLGLAGVAAFRWSVRSDQYDDLEGAAARILLDADEPDERKLPERK